MRPKVCSHKSRKHVKETVARESGKVSIDGDVGDSLIAGLIAN